MEIMLQRILSLIPKKSDGKYVHGAKKDFCERIGAPTNIVSEWEKGKTKSYRNYVYVISAQYGVSVKWLTGESNEKETTAAGFSDGLSSEDIKFLELFGKLSPEEQKLFVIQMQSVVDSKKGEEDA